MHRTMGTTTRRLIPQSGLLLSLVVAVLLGAMLIQDVDAKTKISSIKARVVTQRELCEVIGGGAFSAKKTPFGSTITKCKGGDKLTDGVTCVNTKKSTKCSQAVPPPQPSLPDLTQDPIAPQLADPADVIDQPLEPSGGGVVITSYDGGGTHDQSKHHRRGHGRGRKG